MVFIRNGEALDFQTNSSLARKLRQLATLEFVNIYHENLHRTDPVRLFGDEIEYLVVHIDECNSKVRLFPIYPHVAQFLEDKRHLKPDAGSPNNLDQKTDSSDSDDIEFEKSYFTPEYSSYMVESIPDEPYSLDSDYVCQIRKSVRNRRKRLERILSMLGYSNAKVTTLSNFLRLGCQDCSYYGDEKFRKILTNDLDTQLSKWFPTICLSPISRFYHICNNIRLRRKGTKIYVKRFVELKSEEDSDNHQEDMRVSEDATVCKESTARGVKSNETDSLSKVLEESALFPLLSTKQRNQAKPFLTGQTLNFDSDLSNHIFEQVYSYDPLVRDRIKESTKKSEDDKINNFDDNQNFIFMDTVGFGMGMCCLQLTYSCYNIEEARYLHDQFVVLSPLLLSLSASTVGYRGMLADIDTRWPVLVQAMDDLNDDRDIVKKSRFSTTLLYIGNSDFCVENYKYLNDLKVASDSDTFIHLTNLGVDPILARSISHTVIYQPLVVYDEDFDNVNCNETDTHYRIFHSTLWSSVRFNHPTYCSNPNIKSGHSKIPWRVEFRPMDIQLTDEENVMFISVVSYVVKVLLKKRFNLYMPISLVDYNMDISSKIESCHKEMFYFREDFKTDNLNVRKFSLYDILFGQVGLFTAVLEHLEEECATNKISKESYDDLRKYFKHFEQLSLGKSPTNATRLRRYILTHPDYSGDGSISDKILYDIVQNLTGF